MVRDTAVVTRLRDQLRAEWTVTSADIQFHKRLMYDLDLGPHISVKGRIMFSGDRAPEGAISPQKMIEMQKRPSFQLVAVASILWI